MLFWTHVGSKMSYFAWTINQGQNTTLKKACPVDFVACGPPFHCRLMLDRQVQPTIIECQKSMIHLKYRKDIVELEYVILSLSLIQ